MRFVDYWRDVTVSLTRHKVRTSLTALGVFWGICLVVLLMGLGKGLERGLFEVFRDNAFNSIWYMDGKASMPYQGLPPGRPIKLTIDDVHALGRTLTGVADLTPRKELQGQRPVTYGRRSGAFTIMAIYPGYHVIEQSILTEGRLINWRDVQEGRRVAVIGAHVVKLLFGDRRNPVGERIDLQGSSYLVVGTFTDAGGADEVRRIYIPYTAAQRSFSLERRIDMLAFTVADQADSGALDHKVRSVLAVRHRVDAADLAAVPVFNNYEEYKKFRTLFTGMAIFVALMGAGTLFAGLVGVGNIMLIAVRERTKEIGLRKALGATPPTILLMVLLETLLLTSVAGGVGLVVGIGAIDLLRHLGLRGDYFRDPEVDLTAAMYAFAILLIGGIAAGLIPAWQASRIHPVEALRTE